MINIKVASYYTPSKWEGQSGFHKAVSEDPKQYQIDKLKNDVKAFGVAVPSIIPSLFMAGGAFKKAIEHEKLTNKDFYNIPTDVMTKTIGHKIYSKYGPAIGLSLISGSIIANKFLKNKYLESKGISKKPFGGYSFNEEAQKKYLNLNKEAGMIDLEAIKEAAYKNELEKIAIRNQVAEYGIRGGEVGTAIGSTGAAGLAFALLKKMKVKAHRTPIVAAATIAGALAGSRAGGNWGAWYGGGLKGTQNLYQQ
jgi:hypothetical protein